MFVAGKGLDDLREENRCAPSASTTRRVTVKQENLQGISVSCLGSHYMVKIDGVEIHNVRAYHLEQNSDGNVRLTLDLSCEYAETQIALKQPAQ